MRLPANLLVVCVGFLGFAAAGAGPKAVGRDAFDIFHSLYSSGRQFPSSIRHNGMTLFLATVGEGEHFYHGAQKPDVVEGMDWLAFEPDHAAMFAAYPPPGAGHHGDAFLDRGQSLLLDSDAEKPKPPSITHAGWLQTYRTKHPLRLVYIEGVSAGKTWNGTMDFEDFAILGQDNATRTVWWDLERGRGLCETAKNDWGGKIDGIMRMECGFEIILCDFAAHLDLLRSDHVANGTESFLNHYGPDTFFGIWRAVNERLHGLGGRAKVHLDRFVTAYGRGWDLYANSTVHPRLLDVPREELDKIRAEIDDLVNERSEGIFRDVEQWTDWQATADFIVSRYSSRLAYLTSGRFEGKRAELFTELGRSLMLFIDYDSRNGTVELATCVDTYVPKGRKASQASEAITLVATHICERMFAAFAHAKPDAPEGVQDPLEILADLKRDLAWTTWRECGQCQDDELCSFPAWPFGSKRDFELPRCRNSTTAWLQTGYWGEQNLLLVPPYSV